MRREFLYIGGAVSAAAVILVLLLILSSPGNEPEPPLPHPWESMVLLTNNEFTDELLRLNVEYGLIPRDTQILNLNMNRIYDLKPVGELTLLSELFIDLNQVESLEPLKNLTRLKRFTANRNYISDISPLSGLVNMERLSMWENYIENVAPLSSMRKLTELDLRGNQITDVAPLTSLTSLRWLGLADNQIADVTALHAMTWLNFLDIQNNLLEQADIDALLAALPNTTVIYAAPPPMLQHETFLSLHGLGLDDEMFFEAITDGRMTAHIITLDLSYNAITDLSPLAEYTALRHIVLKGNLIGDLSVLYTMDYLHQIDLSGNPVSQRDIDALRAALTSTAVLFDDITSG
jgi:Leucine-rich repeat (LRR) protein